MVTFCTFFLLIATLISLAIKGQASYAVNLTIIFIMYLLPLAIISPLVESFHEDRESHRIEFMLLTRLTRFEIFWGKWLPNLIVLRVPALFSFVYLLILASIGTISWPQFAMFSAGLILFPVSLIAVSALLGLYCSTLMEAKTYSLSMIVLPFLAGTIGWLAGIPGMAVLSPFTALFSKLPWVFPGSLLLYFLLLIAALGIASRGLDRLALGASGKSIS